MTKINKTKKSKKDIIVKNLLDGSILEKKKTFVKVNQKSGNKEVKIFLTPETIYSEFLMSLPNKLISQKEIKWSDINIDDEVSLVIDEDKKDQVRELRKIVVVLEEDE